MKEKPRPLNESILTKNFLSRVGNQKGFCIAAVTVAAFCLGLWGRRRTGQHDGVRNAVHFQTCFTALTASLRRRCSFKKRFFNNRYLFGAFFAGFVLINLVLIMPGLQGLFKVQTLDVMQLMTVWGLSLASLLVIQILKGIRVLIKSARSS